MGKFAAGIDYDLKRVVDTEEHVCAEYADFLTQIQSTKSAKRQSTKCAMLSATEVPTEIFKTLEK